MAGIVDGRHLGVQSLVGQRVGTGLAHAPLAVAAARHLQHAAKPTDGVLVAMLVDPGVLHLDPLAKYAVAFRRPSTSSFSSASRSYEHTSELQSLMRLSYAVFC